jgi:GNAT superfamily N-acetyltransferase
MSDTSTQRLRERVAAVDAGLTVRAVEDTDGPDLTALVAAAYDEYACGPLDPVRFDADLARPASSAASTARRWWVITRTAGSDGPRGPGGTIVASVALGPVRSSADGPTIELHRLYLAPEVRGRGLATALLDGITEDARLAGAATVTAWSDTRLVDAHRRYLAEGFRATGEQRELGDPAGTTEVRFVRHLDDRDPARSAPPTPGRRPPVH